MLNNFTEAKNDHTTEVYYKGIDRSLLMASIFNIYILNGWSPTDGIFWRGSRIVYSAFIEEIDHW